MNPKIWFITGALRGFGRIWTEAALKRGDKVTATARRLADVAGLRDIFGDAVLPLALDVSRPEQVQQVMEQAYSHFGGLDVLVNNADYSLMAAVEEVSDEQIRELFDVNYLGMVRVLRAALPHFRQQGNGHILGVSSGLGIGTLPLIGYYSATKWAVEALHESLAQEVGAFGIRVTLVEPGRYATDFGKSATIADVLEPYAELRTQFRARVNSIEAGDPVPIHYQRSGFHRDSRSDISVSPERFLARLFGISAPAPTPCRAPANRCDFAHNTVAFPNHLGPSRFPLKHDSYRDIRRRWGHRDSRIYTKRQRRNAEDVG